MRVVRVLLGATFLVGAALLGLYGVLAIGYHDGGGDAYIKFNGGEVDAGLAGGVALSIAVGAAIVAILLIRPGKAKSTS